MVGEAVGLKKKRTLLPIQYTRKIGLVSGCADKSSRKLGKGKKDELHCGVEL